MSLGWNITFLQLSQHGTAEHIQEIYREYVHSGWRYQQYIPCLDPLGEKPGSREYSLTPETLRRVSGKSCSVCGIRTGRRAGPRISGSLKIISGSLWDMNLRACAQRGVCSVQCVAEADGSAYPCDFYVLDEYRLGNYNFDSIGKMEESETARDFVERSLKIDRGCRECRWYPAVQRGMPETEGQKRRRGDIQRLFL